jgi:hypothetical protein
MSGSNPDIPRSRNRGDNDKWRDVRDGRDLFWKKVVEMREYCIEELKQLAQSYIELTEQAEKAVLKFKENPNQYYSNQEGKLPRIDGLKEIHEKEMELFQSWRTRWNIPEWAVRNASSYLFQYCKDNSIGTPEFWTRCNRTREIVIKQMKQDLKEEALDETSQVQEEREEALSVLKTHYQTFQFEDVWFHPRGETRKEADNRIRDRMNAELTAYLDQIERERATAPKTKTYSNGITAIGPGKRKFQEGTFEDLVKRAIPDLPGRSAFVIANKADNRKVNKLALFLSIDLPELRGRKKGT